MTQLTPFAARLSVLGMVVGLFSGIAAASDTASSFNIMSEQEIAAHKESMQRLQGSARGQYRNAQYEMLRQRALEQGYRMPLIPPWDQAGAEPGEALTPSVSGAGNLADSTAAPVDPAATALARHQAMREKMQTHRAANAGPNAAAAAATAESSAQTAAPSVDVEPAAAAETADTKAAPAVGDIGQTPAPAPTVGADPSATGANMITAAPSPSQAPARPVPPSPPGIAARPIPTSPVPPPAAAAPATRLSGEAQDPATATDPAAATGEVETTSDGAATASSSSYANSDAMNAYRAELRSRFSEYMAQRQTQREQREARVPRNRPPQGLGYRGPYPAYAYPPGGSYAPRYPVAPPGYPAPYWQQR